MPGREQQYFPKYAPLQLTFKKFKQTANNTVDNL